MRDLYKRLGVPTSSAEAEIRSALTRTPHAGLRKDIEAVLLDPARRWVYDRIHAVIADTGRLRARLGLNHPPNWQGIAASDFSVIDDAPLTSLYEELSAKVDAVSKTTKRAEFFQVWKYIISAVGILAALFGIFWLAIIFVDGGSLSSSRGKAPSSIAVPRPTLPQPSQPRSDAGKQAQAKAPSRSPKEIAPLSWDEIVRWEEYLQFTPEQKAQARQRFREVFGDRGLGNLPPLPWDELIDTSAYKALTAEDKALVAQWASLFLRYRDEAYRNPGFVKLPQELARERGQRLIPSIPLPESGETRRFTQQEAVAPFEIKSSTGSHYLVKLRDAYSNAEILTVFVRGGSTVQIEAPLGIYVVKYCSGHKWYGYKHRFGSEESCSKADEIFRFERNGSQVTGYTITLYTVAHGNLHTYAIRPEDF